MGVKLDLFAFYYIYQLVIIIFWGIKNQDEYPFGETG
jgi:hypothetical protein